MFEIAFFANSNSRSIIELVQQGKLIDAVALVHKELKLGLKESKEIVDIQNLSRFVMVIEHCRNKQNVLRFCYADLSRLVADRKLLQPNL